MARHLLTVEKLYHLKMGSKIIVTKNGSSSTGRLAVDSITGIRFIHLRNEVIQIYGPFDKHFTDSGVIFEQKRRIRKVKDEDKFKLKLSDFLR